MEVKPIDEDLDSVKYHIRPEDIDAARRFLSALEKPRWRLQLNEKYGNKLKSAGWRILVKNVFLILSRRRGLLGLVPGPLFRKVF